MRGTQSREKNGDISYFHESWPHANVPSLYKKRRLVGHGSCRTIGSTHPPPGETGCKLPRSHLRQSLVRFVHLFWRPFVEVVQTQIENGINDRSTPY